MQHQPEYRFVKKIVNGKLEGMDVIFANKQFNPLSNILKMIAMTDHLDRLADWLDEDLKGEGTSLETSLYTFSRQDNTILVTDNMSHLHWQLIPPVNEQKFKVLCLKYTEAYNKNIQAATFSLLEIMPTSKIVKMLEADLIELCEEKRQVSFPTLYKKGQRYYLALYAYHYLTINNHGDRALSYPTHIYFVDLKDGTIISRYRINEFNPFKNKNNGSMIMKEAYEQMLTIKEKLKLWRLLDTVRFNYLQTNAIDNEMYQYYLEAVQATVSRELDNFYADLSHI